MNTQMKNELNNILSNPVTLITGGTLGFIFTIVSAVLLMLGLGGTDDPSEEETPIPPVAFAHTVTPKAPTPESMLSEVDINNEPSLVDSTDSEDNPAPKPTGVNEAVAQDVESGEAEVSEEIEPLTLPGNVSTKPTPPAAPATPQIFRASIKQGDKIFANNSQCTLSYANAETRIAYTAAHCIDKQAKYTGYTHPVEVYAYNNNNRMVPIGTSTISLNGVDLAVIKINDDISIGDNLYSGDIVLGRTDIAEGDMVCRYGARSQKQACSKYSFEQDNVIFVEDEELISGDSGGPTWVTTATGDIKGYLGVYVGSARVTPSWTNETVYYDRLVPIDAQDFHQF